MNLLITATAGTMESNDIMITLEPAQSGGIQISLTSNVLQQFGRQIEAVIRDTNALESKQKPSTPELKNNLK